MANEKEESSGSLADLIKSTKKQTEDGLEGWELKEPIKLELSATVSGGADGGLDIRIIKFGAKVSAEEVQKITVVIGPKDDVKIAKDRADIAEAQERERSVNKRMNQNLWAR